MLKIIAKAFKSTVRVIFAFIALWILANVVFAIILINM